MSIEEKEIKTGATFVVEKTRFRHQCYYELQHPVCPHIYEYIKHLEDAVRSITALPNNPNIDLHQMAETATSVLMRKYDKDFWK